MLFFYMKISFIITVLGFLVLVSCSGAKRYYKQGIKYEESGMIDMAAEMYLNAIKSKPTYIDARIKLKDIGQRHVAQLSTNFFKNYSTQDYEACLENFTKLKSYCEQSQSFEIQLDYPKSYDDDYSVALEAFSEDQYVKSKQWLRKKRYPDALQHIQKIRKFNPQFKNTEELFVIASCEPQYQTAVLMLGQKKYELAIQALQTIKTVTTDYKDYSDLYDLTVLKLQKRILVLPKNTKASSESETQLYQSFLSISSPTLEFINEPTFLKSASQLELHQNVLAQATGASHIVLYSVSDFNQNTIGPRRTSYTAYQEYRYKKNDQIFTDYNPVSYANVRGERYLQYKFEYSIYDNRQNRSVESKSESIKASDIIEYNEFDGQYQGNINQLYRNRPTGNIVLGEGVWRNLFSARNKFLSYEALKQQAFDKNKTSFTSIINRIK